MINLRHGIFETNSSSMHSLIIMKLDERYSPEEILDSLNIENGKIRYTEYDLSFSRHPFRVLCTFGEKLRLVIATIGADRYYEGGDAAYYDFLQELKKIIRKYDEWFSGFEFPNYFSVHYVDSSGQQYYGSDVKKKIDDNGKTVFYTEEDTGEIPLIRTVDLKPTLGYVEGWSPVDALGKNPSIEKIEEFLTMKKYIPIIDGDEYCDWDKVLQSGIVDTDKFADFGEADSEGEKNG